MAGRAGPICDCGQCRRYKTGKKKFAAHCADIDAPCWLCGQAINYALPHQHVEAYTLDHRLPQSTHKHLTEDPANWMPAHASCNKSRGNRAPINLGTTSRRW